MIGVGHESYVAGIVMLLIALKCAGYIISDLHYRWKNRKRAFIGRHWGLQGRTPHKNF